jgi:hypothetical protein
MPQRASSSSPGEVNARIKVAGGRAASFTVVLLGGFSVACHRRLRRPR